MNVLITLAGALLAIVGAWLAVGLILAWAHHTWTWQTHVHRLEAGYLPRRVHFIASLTYPTPDPEPAPRVRRIPPCDCRGTLHDWSGVTHTPTGCSPLREHIA